MTSVSVTSSVRMSGGRSYSPEVLGDPLDERDVGELSPRDVDCEPDVDAGLAPDGQLAAPLGKDEIGDLADQAHLLGDPDELLVGDRTLHGMVPADEGLDLHDLAGPDVRDRLVHQAQLRPRLKSLGQETTEHEPAVHALVLLD